MNVFIGHYPQVLDAFHRLHPVNHIIIESGKSAAKEVIEYAEAKQIPLSPVANSPEIDDLFREMKVDKAVVASFGLILRKATIQACRRIINFHPGDIELFRGRHPLPQTILNGWPEMAISAHLIDSESIDAGPILGRLLLPIDYNSSYSANCDRLLKSLPSFAHLILKQAFNGSHCHRSFIPKAGSYYPPVENSLLKKMMHSDTLQKYCR